MIDAGGEVTLDADEDKHLVDYLNSFFAARPDLNRTLEAVIISHPHIDHTKKLMEVITNVTVKSLSDGGDMSGSGIGPLKRARKALTEAKYFAVDDTDVREFLLRL